MILTDGRRMVRITIRAWDAINGEYGPDRSLDLYDAGSLNVSDDGVYKVADVAYCIDQANDMVAGEGDYTDAGPQPELTVLVDELDGNRS
ncbi:hypothetical protein [Bifidobacterium felsineum]|uniref:hypothetical protein n=1 Tax=Bifidobacterium felsineum TaxID=2045440 RepID=UPI001BDD8D7B|nr:hypothetical protein [Bifidobacterium felsineum]MBT1164642.1 hypothetical protein [Bifidobacterium felsineum]